MLELAMFTGLLSSVSGLIKVANESKNVEVTNGLIELQQRILDMQGSFGELQQKYFDVQQEVRGLVEKLRAVEEQLSVRGLPMHDGAYWQPKPDGNESGPFCPSCWGDGRLERPQVFSLTSGTVRFVCTRHKDGYYFDVPENLAREVNLDRYRQRGIQSARRQPRSGGPRGWMI